MRCSCSLILVLLLSFGTAFGQKQLLVKHDESGLYLEHNVAAKENFYSIGRLYNIHPKELAAFNKLDMNKGLNLGQAIRIPMNESNFSQARATKGEPVYYVVGEKEGLYRVSVNNNKVLMENLRQWNKLANDNISAGQKLVVGFLVGGSETGSVAQTDVSTEPETGKEEKKGSEGKVTDPSTNDNVSQKKNNPEPAVQHTSSVGETGYFKNHFDQQVKSSPASKDQTVTAGIFKTASGWQDKKYYMLIDKVEPGTIVKLINPSNNKAIYAKVLGEMSGIRQNAGLDIRISNAAASALEIADTDKFIVKVNY